jgi:hypothetical protein
MVISPVVGWAICYFERRSLRGLGVVVGSLGLVGLLALLGWSAATWEASYGAMTGTAVGLRFAYLLATRTELPVVQVVLAGTMLWVASVRWKPSAMQRREPPRPPSNGDGVR